ncbi:amidohydrolase [Aestuariibacter sp. AA17]|uniref:Amidohydrolase n=1 Tax=Fluctibacter corallii TaxID=2984329 RepID=A0ABT3A7K5_9ALTE|nr:amidohydrolase [Aestuariibacter sp. AA17]MCV2884669.1 amidohydrolase [Aestuariibacter sp. AA17]
MLRIVFSLLFATIACTAHAASLVIHNANGYTIDQEGKLSSFSALAIKEGKVQAVGSEALVTQYPKANKINAKGKTLLPGLIDAHGHLFGLGDNLLQIDVRGLSSAKATASAVANYVKKTPSEDWIVGRGWNQVLWPEKSFPNAKVLDELVPDRPIYLERVDGHAAWLNSKAMALANINAESVDPPGGSFIRDEHGNPTGVLIDNAMNSVLPLLPKADSAYIQKAIQHAGDHLLSLGVTSMHDAGIDYRQYHIYQDMAKQGTLPVRVYAMIAATDPKLDTMLNNGFVRSDNDQIWIRSVKAYGDGALGSRGAAMLSAYSDDTDNKGLLVTSEHALKPLFDTVIGKGFQLNYHAIGDRANRLALDQFKDTFARLGGKTHRHRIEHAQVVQVGDIPRFADIGIIPSMQPTHATSDMNMAEDRVGKQRLKGAYAWKSFLKHGSIIALGSDFPVELANPFYGIHAAVTRQDRNDQPKQGWIPEEALTVEEAFTGFTYSAAYAAHQEAIVGRLIPGAYADFILIDQDIFAGPATSIWRTNVLETWLAGEKVYSASNSQAKQAN